MAHKSVYSLLFGESRLEAGGKEAACGANFDRAYV